MKESEDSMKHLMYELRTAACIHLFDLVLWVVPKNTVFATVVSGRIAEMLKEITVLEANGWMSGRHG